MCKVDLTILNKNLSFAIKNNFFREFTKNINSTKLFENDITVYFSNHKKGIDFIFNSNILTTMHFYGENHNDYSLFRGDFPFNISIYDNLVEVLNKFNDKEIERGGREVLPFLGLSNLWIKFLINDCHVRYEFDNDEISLITITKNKIGDKCR